ncbi:MAG: hypothetical protein ACPHCN_16340 [Mycobacterium sp.]
MFQGGVPCTWNSEWLNAGVNERSESRAAIAVFERGSGVGQVGELVVDGCAGDRERISKIGFGQVCDVLGCWVCCTIR